MKRKSLTLLFLFYVLIMQGQVNSYDKYVPSGVRNYSTRSSNNSERAPQSYKNWDNYDVISFYEKKEINLDYNSLDQNGEEISVRTITYYAPTKIKDGVYEVEIGDKISSKFYAVSGTSTYLYFRYTPYLYKFDEGILVVSYSSGTFYKKP